MRAPASTRRRPGRKLLGGRSKRWSRGRLAGRVLFTNGLGVVLALLAATNAAAVDGSLEPAPPGLEARDLARRAEDVMRGATTYIEATMTILSPRLLAPRVVSLRSWDDRPGKRSFIRILAPAKDAGTSFLKIQPNLWMYVPRVERTVRIPPSMMLQSWMGSDFSNDDLVRESSQLEDYDHRILGIDAHAGRAGDRRAYVVEYVPHEDAAVVWGRIVSWIEVEHFTLLRSDYYDEKGQELRTMRFGDIRPVQERHFPFRWEMTPLDKKGHRTTIEIAEIRFDEPMKESTFTMRNLKTRARR